MLYLWALCTVYCYDVGYINYYLQVSERAKGHCMARALTPMEILMEEIRTPPILRRVHNSYSTVSDSEVITRKKLMPSDDLVANLSEEVSC